ncbi:MAG TPA: iron-containing alcohol dehydrogenase [Desulfurivibrio alkaliphilus]|uniref:Iron-containing alcohol dehydrogenase n=1 Tax=Desulfurivibrio alkaliphilus TaxID=427923 RepID=A0A7C2TLL0_9BACT|nr:iron-containing alcohol dehydrogenase [Desulfurivibrio alkaliphilus]
MFNFVFHHPTRVIFQRRGLTRLGEECARLASKVLLVYGRRSLKASGRHREVCASLATAGVSWLELGGISPNPTLSLVRRGIALAREYGVGAVVAVGGGSVMDSAKAIAAGACVKHDPWLFFRGKKSIKRALPLLCVPTLAGSGSECNPGMVLSNEENGQKIGIGNRHLYPATAILDPELTCSSSWRQTLFGAVDSICHLAEFFCTDPSPHHRLQDRLAAGLIRSIMESCERVRPNLNDYPGRATLLWASSLALYGLNSAGRGRIHFPAHLVAHALGGRHDLPHGAALAVLLPAWLKFEAQRNPSRVAALAQAVFDLSASDASTMATRGIRRWQSWLRGMDAPVGLIDLGLPPGPGELEAITAHAAPQARLWRLPYSEDDIARILALAAA